jgi:hypothetical protein
MKKNLMILAVAVLGMVSCSEERVEKTLLEEYSAIKAIPGHWADKSCFDPGSGCYVLDTVIIKPGMIENIADAIIVGPNAINALFVQSEYSDLVFGIDHQYLDLLQNGDVYMSVKFDNPTEIAYYVGETPNPDEHSATFAFKVLK